MKMKRLEKLRVYLVKKLKGNPYPPTEQKIKYEVTHPKIDLLQACYIVPHHDIGNGMAEDLEKYVKTELAHRIGISLQKEGYIRYISCTDQEENSVRIRAKVKVIRPDPLDDVPGEYLL